MSPARARDSDTTAAAAWDGPPTARASRTRSRPAPAIEARDAGTLVGAVERGARGVEVARAGEQLGEMDVGDRSCTPAGAAIDRLLEQLLGPSPLGLNQAGGDLRAQEIAPVPVGAELACELDPLDRHRDRLVQATAAVRARAAVDVAAM